MTDQHPSFGGVAVADPRTTTSPLDLGAEGAPDDNRRKLALVGAVLAVVVVLIAAFFMLKGKGSSDNAGPVVPHVVRKRRAIVLPPSAWLGLAMTLLVVVLAISLRRATAR